MLITSFSGLTLLEDQNLSQEELITYARSLSTKPGDIQKQLLHWDFGPVMTMMYDRKAENYLFSDEEVPFHWDGAFFIEPRKLLFYCTETKGQGGETLFSNTESLWDSLSKDEQEECKKVTLTYTTEKKAHYGGKINVPLVQLHPDTERPILRMAERVETKLNPVELQISGAQDAEGLYAHLRTKLRQAQFMYEHQWKRGDLVVCDNFTYLHGRRALGSNQSRTFKRIQIL
jgi:alpha-ketoglutarate-dependent taurine dioxygenase